MYLSLSVLDSHMVLDGSHTPQKTQREPRTKSPPLMGKTDFAELMKAQAQLMKTSNNSFIDKLGLLMASSDTMDKKSALRAELAQLNDLIKNEPEHNIKELHKGRKTEVVSLLYGA